MEIKRYVNLPTRAGDAEPVVSYVMDSLLQSRIATGHESNTEAYDEDVNVYLALLLSSLVDSRYLAWSAQFVTAYESDIFEKLQYTQDTYVKFLTYKVNADYLLLSQGIFEVPPSIYSTVESRGREAIQRGKAYYQIAGTLTRQLHEDRRALADVLQKLSDGYEKYLVVLSYMRGEYFNIVKEISPGEFFHLSRDIDSMVVSETLRRKRDTFLDLYSAWKAALGTMEETPAEARLRQAERDLAATDPTFRSPLDPPNPSRRKGGGSPRKSATEGHRPKH
jgi:hypothetical protein